MGTESVESGVERRRAGSGHSLSGVQFVEGTDNLSTESPGERSSELAMSVSRKSLTFRSNVLRLQHREQLRHLQRQSRIILEQSRIILRQSRIIGEKVKDLQQLSNDLLHEDDDDTPDRTA